MSSLGDLQMCPLAIDFKIPQASKMSLFGISIYVVSKYFDIVWNFSPQLEALKENMFQLLP